MRLGDAESAAFAESAIGTHVEEFTAHAERQPSPLGEGMVTTKKETRLQQEPDFRGDFGKFEAGECVVARQGEGLVHGKVRLIDRE